MKTIALVPARSGSKSIKRKNLAQLSGHPLLAYAIVLGKLSEEIDDVVVSTDSEEFAEVARGYGASVPFLRPKEISQDDSTDEEFFRHYLKWAELEGGGCPDLIVHLRPTTPFRDQSVVDEAVRYMRSNEEVTSLRSMSLTELTPYKMFRSHSGIAEPFMTHDTPEFYNLPRQSFPTAYIPNGIVDVIRPSVLLETGLLHGDRIKIWETESVPDIDSPSDFRDAKHFLSENVRFSRLIIALEESNEGGFV